MVSCDMSISKEQVNCYLQNKTRLIRLYLSELCQIKFDLATFKYIFFYNFLLRVLDGKVKLKKVQSRDLTRGVQYVMKTVQYIPDFYIYTHFIISFIKRSVSWLNNSKIAVVQLPI